MERTAARGLGAPPRGIQRIAIVCNFDHRFYAISDHLMTVCV